METDTVLATDALKDMWSATGFGELVRSMRKCDGITQTELARRMGVSKQYLCGIEKEKEAPTLNHAVKIAAAFGYDARLFVEKALVSQLKEANMNYEISLKDR